MGMTVEEYKKLKLKSSNNLPTENSEINTDPKPIDNVFERHLQGAENNFIVPEAFLPENENVAGVTRAFGQGLTLGWGDEVEAFTRSTLGSDNYEESLKKVRDSLETFRKTNPVKAYSAEIAGSILPTFTPIGAIGKGIQGVKGLSAVGKGLQQVNKLGPVQRATVQGGVEGGIYGAGVSKEGERLKGAGVGAGFGVAGGGIFSYLLPKSSAAAEALRKKGVSTTAGQTFSEGPTGKVMKGFEESITSFLGFGGSVAAARLRGLSDFNKLVMLEAVSPVLTNIERQALVKQISKENGNIAFSMVDDVMKQKYDEAVKQISLPIESVKKLENSFKDILKVQFADIINPSDQIKAIKIFNRQLNKHAKLKSGSTGKTLDGENLKLFQTKMIEESKDFKKTGGIEGKIGEAFSELNDILDSEISKYGGDLLPKARKAWAGLVPVKIAVNKANKTEGIFSTKQFLDSLKQSDTLTKTKTSTAKGKNIFNTKKGGNLPKLANEVMGSTIPDSGTASRLVSANLLGGGAKEMLKTFGFSIVGDIFYSAKFGALSQAMLRSLQPTTKGLLPYTSMQATSGVLGNDESMERKTVEGLLRKNR